MGTKKWYIVTSEYIWCNDDDDDDDDCNNNNNNNCSIDVTDHYGS